MELACVCFDKKACWSILSNRPDRAKRRLKGKSDPADAENAARSVLANESTAIPK